jgi:hypothetical protein
MQVLDHFYSLLWSGETCEDMGMGDSCGIPFPRLLVIKQARRLVWNVLLCLSEFLQLRHVTILLKWRHAIQRLLILILLVRVFSFFQRKNHFIKVYLEKTENN